MGYAIVTSPCIGCNRIFGYNPHRVPSIRIDGKREPICKECIERINPQREAKGLEAIAPHADAYTAISEYEL